MCVFTIISEYPETAELSTLNLLFVNKMIDTSLCIGWWQYDERTSRELEASYKGGIRTCELLIAGFLYTADFDSMVQMRRNEPHRRRRIKRDLATIPHKGVAGIKHVVNVDSVLEQFSSLTLSDNAVDE